MSIFPYIACTVLGIVTGLFIMYTILFCGVWRSK